MNDEAILEVIRTNRPVAGEALATLPPPPGSDGPRSAAVLDGAAAILGVDPARYWLDRLRDDGQVLAFVAGLQARGIRIDTEELEDPSGAIPIDSLMSFLPRAKSFRCRILKDGQIAGSGVLVGPRLVLTAWHVIAAAAPGQQPAQLPSLSVLLADTTVQPAGVPAEWFSECGDDEYRSIPPVRDADVVDRNDVAILAMEGPVGAHLGFVSLTPPAPEPKSRSRVVVVHYPNGQDVGVDFGRVTKIRNVTARWRHDVVTKPGSSGGACFNGDLQFVGVHQGDYDTEKRFVPLYRFLDQALEYIKKDVAPAKLWSLDGTFRGKLVVGRDLFFETIAAAGEASKRVRGIRIKRKAIGSGAAGLAFSHDILEQLLARRGPNHVLVRVTQDEMIPDLVAEIRRRAQAKGLEIREPESEPGVAPGQAPPETTAKNRASILAASVEAAAITAHQIVWFFFDNPGVALSEGARLAFEGFVDSAMVQPHLRLVIAGFETLSLPGLEFAGAYPAEGDRSPGLVVEFLGGFRRTDLQNFLSEATRNLPGGSNQPLIDYAVTRALIGIDGLNDNFTDEQLATVTERLRTDLQVLRGTPPGP